MNLNELIFREYDIRGIAGTDLSAEFAHRLGIAYAKLIEGDSPRDTARNRLKVAVGRDCRLTSDDYAEALMKGMLEGGLDVVDLGTCPTPLTYFSVHHLTLDGSIMVTGSHNASEYNGFKICRGTHSVFGDQIQKLKELIRTEARPAPTEPGTLSQYEIIEAYTQYHLDQSPNVKPMKIVLDAGNGTAATVAPQLFEKLGADVIPLYCELDGRFPNHHPDPTVHKNLKDLVEKVRSEGAHFGVAFDGDSDRIGLVDESGRIVFGDELMVILSRAVLKEHPGATIISEVKSSHRLYNDIAAKGGNGIMWKTGHSLIKTKMKETKAALAGEMSGHIFFADRYFGFDDAVYAAVRVYEIASAHDGPVSSLISDLEPVVATPEIRVDCEESLKFDLVTATKENLKDHQINDIDGIRIDFGDSWGLVRASNTQPALVLRFEAPNETRLSEVRKIMEDALHAGATQISHPALTIA